MQLFSEQKTILKTKSEGSELGEFSTANGFEGNWWWTRDNANIPQYLTDTIEKWYVIDFLQDITYRAF